MPNIASSRQWEVDLLLGVDVHEATDPAPIVGGKPVAVHATPKPLTHKRQDGGAPRVVEGHHIVHLVMLTIFPRLIPMVIKPMSRRRHQQAGYIPMVEIKPGTFIIADSLAKISVAYG
jgi:hypothetical protein